MPLIKKYQDLGSVEQQKYDRFFNLCEFGDVKGVEKFIEEKGDILIEINGKTAYETLKEKHEKTRREIMALDKRKYDPSLTQDPKYLKELEKELENQTKVLLILEKNALLQLSSVRSEIRSFLELRNKNDVKGEKEHVVSVILRAGAEQGFFHASSFEKDTVVPRRTDSVKRVLSMDDKQAAAFRALKETPEFNSLLGNLWLRYSIESEKNQSKYKDEFKLVENKDPKMPAKVKRAQDALDVSLYLSALEGDEEQYKELLRMGADKNRKITKANAKGETTPSAEMKSTLDSIAHQQSIDKKKAEEREIKENKERQDVQPSARADKQKTIASKKPEMLEPEEVNFQLRLFNAAVKGDKDSYDELIREATSKMMDLNKIQQITVPLPSGENRIKKIAVSEAVIKIKELNDQLIMMALKGDKPKFDDLVKQGAKEDVLVLTEEGNRITAKEVLDLTIKFGLVEADKRHPGLSGMIHQDKHFDKVLENQFEGNPTQTFAFRLGRIREFKSMQDLGLAKHEPRQQFTVAHKLNEEKLRSELKVQKEALLALARKGDELGFSKLEKALVEQGVNVNEILEKTQIGGATKKGLGAKENREALETVEISASQLLKINLLKKYARSGDFEKFNTVESQLEGIDVNKITLQISSKARTLHVPIPEILNSKLNSEFEKAIRDKNIDLASKLYDTGKIDPKRVDNLAKKSKNSQEHNPEIHKLLNSLLERGKEGEIHKPNA